MIVKVSQTSVWLRQVECSVEESSHTNCQVVDAVNWGVVARIIENIIQRSNFRDRYFEFIRPLLTPFARNLAF